MDEIPNPGENEDPARPFFAVRMKKRATGGLVGETVGGALIWTGWEGV
jgi:hypothetical protein